jgi:hypothetical protein
MYIQNPATAGPVPGPNGAYFNDQNGIAGGGGGGASATGSPYSLGGGLNPIYYISQPYDYLTYAAGVSVLDPVDNTRMIGSRGGQVVNAAQGYGGGVIKIICKTFRCNSAVIYAKGTDGGVYKYLAEVHGDQEEAEEGQFGLCAKNLKELAEHFL